jgi:hypothetical protein
VVLRDGQKRRTERLLALGKFRRTAAFAAAIGAGISQTAILGRRRRVETAEGLGVNAAQRANTAATTTMALMTSI